MSYFIATPKVGRSQGASIFWGLISTCFAAAACFYFFKYYENEANAGKWRDQVLQLTSQTDSLNSQITHLQASKAETDTQLKMREDLVQEKETQLAAEETRIEAITPQSQSQSAQNTAQGAMVKRFSEAIRKLGNAGEVVERGGRPVLRIPSAQLFSLGESTLRPEGKALLGQIAQSVNGQLGGFELRVTAYTDTVAEADSNAGSAKAASGAAWELTGARAAALSRYFRSETALPFLSVIVTGRGDAEPIVSNLKEDHVRNRRVEITVVPLPPPYRAQDASKAAAPAPTTDQVATTDATTTVKKVDTAADKSVDKTPVKKTPMAH